MTIGIALVFSEIYHLTYILLNHIFRLEIFSRIGEEGYAEAFENFISQEAMWTLMYMEMNFRDDLDMFVWAYTITEIFSVK